MNNLDDLSQYKKYDSVNVLGSIEQLAQQCRQADEEVGKINFPENYRKVKNIVFSGMGGSALGAYVTKSLYFDSLNLPFEVINDYHLPPYVNEDTLVLLGTYSGTTEETLSCAQEAQLKKACVSGFTTGGKLANIYKENNFPGYIFSPKHNPSGQPRLGSGYSVFSLIKIFSNLGFIDLNNNAVTEVIDALKKGNEKYGVKTETKNNPAKLLAIKWEDKIPVIVAGQYLTNVGRVLRNQIHETAKSFAAFHDLPELNHHLMEGLKNPGTNKEILKFLFISSAQYSDRIKKRVAITRDVVSKNGIESDEFKPVSENKIAQVFECIQFGAYVNYYMAIGYGLDPSKIPWVDYFKAELSK